MIAIALACEPKLLIADEPTTALDVTIQAQILALLEGLRDKLGMAMLLITHDLGVVAEIADRVLVMYAGRIVEEGHGRRSVRRPRHPYTRGLLESCPRDRTAAAAGDPGHTARPGRPPAAAAFAPRCPLRERPACAQHAAAADDRRARRLLRRRPACGQSRCRRHDRATPLLESPASSSTSPSAAAGCCTAGHAFAGGR